LIPSSKIRKNETVETQYNRILFYNSNKKISILFKKNKMKKIIIIPFLVVISFLCFLSKISFGQAPDWLWAKSAAGTNDDAAYSIAVDASGNIYVAGDFRSPTLTFGSYTLTNAGWYDIFLAKYDTNGNVLWAKSAGGTGDDRVYSVAVDASGNAYLVGWFTSTLTFGSDTLTNAGYCDIFLAKYDSNGNVLWGKSAGGTDDDVAYSVAVDASGNTYLAGYFGSSTLSFDITTLTNANTNGSYDLFLAKYAPNGNVLWAKSAGGTDGDVALSVAVDASGNTYLAGYFMSSTITFGSTTLTNAGSANIFLAKYDANGNVLWAKSAGGTYCDWATSVAVDTSGNTYLAGNFQSITLTFGSTTLTNAGSADIFLAKYAPNGNMLWAKSAVGTNYDYAWSVAVDASENIYLTGYFTYSPLTFGSITLTNAGYYDIFLAKYDANGNVLWAKSAGGTDGDVALSVAVDASGNTYMAGYFGSSTLSFGAIILTNANTSNTTDIFLAKSGNGTGINELSNSLSISVFPNPSKGTFTIEFTLSDASSPVIISVNDLLGKTIYKSVNNYESEGIYSVEVTLKSAGAAIMQGMYFVNLKNGTKQYVKKIGLIKD